MIFIFLYNISLCVYKEYYLKIVNIFNKNEY